MAAVRFSSGVLLPEEAAYYQGDLDLRLARYEDWVLWLAGQHSDPDWKYNGAELEDLAQVGRLAVWTALQKNKFPTEVRVRGAMLDYCRTLSAQRSLSTDSGEEVHHYDEGEEVTFFDQAALEQWRVSEMMGDLV